MSSPPDRFLRLPEVIARVGLGRSALFARVKKGGFPKPIALAPRTLVWPESTINNWIEVQKAGNT